METNPRAPDTALLATWSERLFGVAVRMVDVNGGCPTPGSDSEIDWMSTELGHPLWGESPAVAADMRAGNALRSAADHGLAAGMVMGSHPLAALTLSRAVMEACALCVYLADPDVEYVERARRAVNEHLYSLCEEGRMFAGAGLDEAAAQKRSQVECMIAFADELGCWGATGGPSPGWQRSAFVGQPRPNIMRLIDRLMSTPLTPNFGAQQYRAASAVAHSAPHAVGLMTDSTSEDTVRETAQRLLPMIGAVRIAAGTLCRRMGWDEAPVTTVAGITLRLWLETVEEGSSRGLLK